MIFLSIFLSACSGVLSFEPRTNKQAAEEAHKFADEAEKTFESGRSQMDAIFAEPVGKDKLSSIKEKKLKFEEAAADFSIAREILAGFCQI